jgi:hypothetical protein
MARWRWNRIRLSYRPMATLRVLRGWIARFGAQRWSKEVLLAIVLTLAAAAFIAAALPGRTIPGQSKAPFVAADKPQQ